MPNVAKWEPRWPAASNWEYSSGSSQVCGFFAAPASIVTRRTGKNRQNIREFPWGGTGQEETSIEAAAPSRPSGFFMLFPKGKRPTRRALRDFAQTQRTTSITHDPEFDSFPRPVDPEALQADAIDADYHPNPNDSPAEAGDTCASVDDLVWVEMMREGLTFDILGIAPGDPAAFPSIEHHFDLESVPSASGYEALQIMPGQHLSGGHNAIPVVKSMLALARDLTHHLEHLEAVVWPAARSAIGRRFFESVTTAWLEGGAFPALGLTAFTQTMDGAIQSVGLDFWIGQELRIEAPLSADKVAATRLGVRLINQLIIVGGLTESERVTAPDGSRLVMRPSRNGKFIRVWQE